MRSLRRRTVRLTPRGWALLASSGIAAGTAYVLGWPALLATAAFIAALVLVGAVSVAVSPVRLAVTRRVVPDTASLGVPVDVQLQVVGAAVSSEWRDRLPDRVAVVGVASGVLPTMHVGAPATDISYGIAASRRGLLAIGPIEVDRLDPLGVAIARRSAGDSTTLTVLPTVHPISPPVLHARVDLDPADATATGATGDQRDAIAREYRPGDALRTVDWRSTAHRGELMVRSETAVLATSTVIVFDVREHVWAGGGDFEWAVECVASLVAAAAGGRGVVRLITDPHDGQADEAGSGLMALATVVRTSGGRPLRELVTASLGVDVQVLHLVTGHGAATELRDLPRLTGGVVGIVSVVGSGSGGVPSPRGWRAAGLDPRRSVSEAWQDRG